MNLRVKGPKVTQTYRGLATTTTLGDFKLTLQKDFAVNPSEQCLSFGMPTQTITSYDGTPLNSIVKSGECITLEIKANSQATTPSTTNNGNTNSSLGPGSVVKRAVPDDNSCLFHAISLCFDHINVEDLRTLIAKTVLADPINWNEGTLQQKPSEYASYIKRTNTWGGSVELCIFSEHYKCEIFVLDTARQRQNNFGEDKNYGKRIYLVYDGIHYDALVWTSNPNSKAWDVTVFDPKNKTAEDGCVAFMKKEFQSGHYVDEYNYKIKCGQCGQVFVGNKNASAHSNATGHTSFTQV
jgi:ubiquitin thioesterase OTU1